MNRISLDTRYMLIAHTVALGSTCLRRKVGAVLLREGRIISTGYNGTPSGSPHCSSDTCGPGKSCTDTIHAEINAITRAREQGDTLYCTDQPCLPCIKAIVSHNSNIRILYWRSYEDKVRDEWCQKMGVEIYEIGWDDMIDKYSALIGLGEDKCVTV